MVDFPKWPMPAVESTSFSWDFAMLLPPNAVELLEKSRITIQKPE